MVFPKLVRRERASLPVLIAAPFLALAMAALSNLMLYAAIGVDPVAVF